MIRIESFSFQYKDSPAPALSDISLNVPKGDFLGIIGPAGAGKTTLAYAICGVIPHHFTGEFYGRVVVNGKDTVETKLMDLAQGVGLVFQDVESQLIQADVEDEMLYGLENFGVPHDQIEARIAQTLQQVGIEDLRGRTIASLSGGQRQKVAIASILALRPQLLVLDEPTGELDPGSSRQIFELLRTLNEQFGVTVVVVEQKIMLLCEFAKHLAVLDGGRLARFGDVGRVLRDAKGLEEIGVHCPRIVTLSQLLYERGVGDGRVCVNLPQAKEMIEEILS